MVVEERSRTATSVRRSQADRRGSVLGRGLPHRRGLPADGHPLASWAQIKSGVRAQLACRDHRHPCSREARLTRYLPEDERIRLADLRRERRTLREIGAMRVARHPPFAGNSCAAPTPGRYRPSRRTGALWGAAGCTVPAVWRAIRPARLGRRAPHGPLEPRAGLSRASSAETRWARTVAVRGDDLPGRLSSRPWWPAQGVPGHVLHRRRRHRVARRDAERDARVR